MLRVVIDDRERAVLPAFEAASTDIETSVERLGTGDYSIMLDDRLLMVIERKTWSDLASSIKDGRIDNKCKLLEVRAETQCKLAYIVEGRQWFGMPPHEDAKCGRMTAKSMRAHLDHLAFRDDIHIIYTKDQDATAWRILELANNLKSIPRKSTEGGGSGGIDAVKRPRSRPFDKFDLWMVMPGMTRASVECVVGLGLLNFARGAATEAEIAALKYKSGRTLGLKKAQKMLSWQSTERRKIVIKILAAIKGVSADTATIIVDQCGDDLDEIAAAAVKLSEIQLSTRKLGAKLAKKIVDALTVS